MKHWLPILLCALVMAQNALSIANAPRPTNPELRTLAEPLELDESLYGCGPLIQPGATYYVSPAGNDTHDGLSWETAWRQPHLAVPKLQPGDTLLIGEGEYRQPSITVDVAGEPGRPIRIWAAPRQRVVFNCGSRVGPFRKAPDLPHGYVAPLRIGAQGEATAPIRIRAYQRRRIRLPGLVLDGAHLQVEGFAVADSAGDGIVVAGRGIQLVNMLVHECKGAGLRARVAEDLIVDHCTFAGNGYGIELRDGTVHATIANGIIALNREGQIRIDASSLPGYRGRNNCWWGANIDTARVAAEFGSISAEPKFVDIARHDYRLAHDSPARYLAEFARPAGTETALVRSAEITGLRAVDIQHQTAVVRWETPTFDTTGTVYYRVAGTEAWSMVADTEQGSLHAVGLVGLKPSTRYDVRLEIVNRRGPGAASELRTFQTAAESRAPATFHLSPTGSDAADGQTPHTAWRTMRQACFAAQPGDTVLAAPGEYHHPIAPIASGLPDRRITFRGHGDGRAVINGRGVLSALVHLHGKDYITVDGFELEPGSSHWVSAPELMVLENCRGVEILNCRRGAALPAAGTGTGIFVRGCSDLRIEGNVLWGARYTLRIFGCRNVLIKNNTLALKSVVTVQVGDTGLGGHGIQFINNLLFENRSFRNGFLWINHQSAVESDYNLYHTSDPKLKLGLVLDGSPEPVYVGDTLRSWQRLSGLDAHSIDADPLLVDPDNRDFRLRPGSPAIGAGKDGANIGALGLAE